jgi:hypothetical protein
VQNQEGSEKNENNKNELPNDGMGWGVVIRIKRGPINREEKG